MKSSALPAATVITGNHGEAIVNRAGATMAGRRRQSLRLVACQDAGTLVADHAEHAAPRPAELAPTAPAGGSLKRALDIAIALTALVLLAPVMVAIAAIIWLTQGGSVVFAHERVGLGGRTFRCLKFRTMVPDAAERLARYLATNEEAARIWAETQKLRNDPRVTWFGHILRKSSLDELPQLFNVLRGEMSCVGPRPVVADELRRYGEHAYEYVKARPGITGLWQVSGRSNTTYAHRVKLDRVYVRRCSLLLDLGILLRTLPAVLKVSETA
jgi:exopolysaccharide production protein ExoY